MSEQMPTIGRTSSSERLAAGSGMWAHGGKVNAADGRREVEV